MVAARHALGEGGGEMVQGGEGGGEMVQGKRAQGLVRRNTTQECVTGGLGPDLSASM